MVKHTAARSTSKAIEMRELAVNTRPSSLLAKKCSGKASSNVTKPIVARAPEGARSVPPPASFSGRLGPMSGSVAADARIRAAAAAERRAGASRRPELEEPPPKRPKAKTNSQILEELGITDHQRDMECTLSHQVFDDPVIADDNHTYERAYIEGYFASCKGRVISPLTNEPLANTQLRPNLQLRKVVEAYVEVEVRKARARLGVSVAPLPTNDDDDDGVAIVGAVTRAERNLAGRSAAVDLTMDDDEMMLPDGTRIDELGLDEAALLRPPEAPHAPPAAPLPAPAALAAVPSVAMPAAASLPPVPVAPGQLTAASTAAAAAAGSKRLKDSDDDEEVVVGQRSRQRSRRGEQNAQIEIATPESISSPAAAAAPEKQSTSEHTQGVPSAGVQHKEPDKDKDKASLAAKVGLIKNEFRIDQKMPMHQAMSVAEAELGFQACNEQSMLQRVEQVLKAAGL